MDLLYTKWMYCSTQNLNIQLKKIIEEILLDLCQILPNRISEDQQRVKKIIEVICLGLAPESFDVKQEWLDPVGDIEEVEPA